MGTIAEEADAVTSRDDLVELLRRLKSDLESKPDGWANADLPSFLEAMAAWIDDMDGYYANQGQPIPTTPSWRTVADILMAGRCYE